MPLFPGLVPLLMYGKLDSNTTHSLQLGIASELKFLRNTLMVPMVPHPATMIPPRLDLLLRQVIL